MNLWKLYPWDVLEWLLNYGVAYALPFVAIALYFYVFYAVIRYKAHRLFISFFIQLSLLASMVMAIQMGPRIGDFWPPLLLVLVVLMPMAVLGFFIKTKGRDAIIVWSLISCAGLMHSVCWSTWLFMLANS